LILFLCLFIKSEMHDFEYLQETTSNQPTADVRFPGVVHGVDAHVAPYSLTGLIGERTENNKYYSDATVQSDVFKLKDHKYRSLWVDEGITRASRAGRDGTYVDMWEYAPGIPAISTPQDRYYDVQTSNTMNDTEMLLDAEHALNAAKHVKLSHGGVRDIPPAARVSPAVDNVVPSVGPDTTDLDSLRGLSYQYNYKDMSSLRLIARENFMKAVAGLRTERDTTARPTTSAVSQPATSSTT
jgi:hypothetical protein